jgi:hypothetical protein
LPPISPWTSGSDKFAAVSDDDPFAIGIAARSSDQRAARSERLDHFISSSPACGALLTVG